jgi:CTP synthase
MVERSTKSYKRTATVGVVANTWTTGHLPVRIRSTPCRRLVAETKVDIKWVDAESLEEAEDVAGALAGLDGIVVPGGFGTRGLEGKIKAAQYSLRHKLPFLGLCLGLQMGVIAAARNAGLSDATSGELDPAGKNKVIHTMADQRGKENTGGTMRLGDYPCKIEPDSLIAKLYGTTEIPNVTVIGTSVITRIATNTIMGIRAAGLSPDGHLVEMIEAIGHPFFVASQFHPEFKSRPNRPHPMFAGFIASLLQKRGE